MNDSEDIMAQCKELIKRGYDFGHIVKMLRVTKGKLLALGKEYPEFNMVLLAVTDKTDNQVEESLLRRALGYRSEEVYCEDLVDKKTGEPLEVTKRRTVIKQVAPDVRAAMAWLENRRPMRWKNTLPEPVENDVSTDSEDIDLL